ncbi:MAG TPA: DUF6166 domain-containing protein [Verrucomicrobiae bacterium]|nr:DUF6166 domain-containing protein [Verrucomicrobiae bacterium]
MKRYEGRREGYAVDATVNGVPLNPRLDLYNHSPTGFEWGYGGSGPAQLALAILADHLGNADEAMSLWFVAMPSDSYSYTDVLGASRTVSGFDYGTRYIRQGYYPASTFRFFHKAH